MDNTNFILYADDTNIFVVGNTKEEAFSKANKVLENVHAYIKYNLLHINMEKCCFMHFQPKSHLTYGISVWGGVSDSKLNKIFIVQKHCIRVLPC